MAVVDNRQALQAGDWKAKKPEKAPVPLHIVHITAEMAPIAKVCPLLPLHTLTSASQAFTTANVYNQVATRCMIIISPAAHYSIRVQGKH